jgi:hypothetical protein
MIARCTRAAVISVALALIIAACGGGATSPGPVTPPPGGEGGTPPPNSAPVIDSIELSAARTEVDSEVTITAHVRDAETPVDQLEYEWKADAGILSGEGAIVKWRAPGDQPTPRDYTISLAVTEMYGTPDASGNRLTNVVSGTSPAIRVHNSPKELGEMGLSFLRKFGDSSTSPQACVSDFSDTCAKGRNDELRDIDFNRKHMVILSYDLGTPRVSYVAGRNNADMWIRSSYTSRITSCTDWPADQGPCVVGSIGTATFDAYLPSVYEKGRWWICDSKALPVGTVTPMMRFFLGPHGGD